MNTQTKKYTSQIIKFENEDGKISEMKFLVEWSEFRGEWVVYRFDLDSQGNIWSSIPYRGFKSFDEAVEGVKSEELKTL
jgi:hypothetical protein